MADIHVEVKKHRATPVWIWIVLILIIAAVVWYFLAHNNKATNGNANPANTTSFIHTPIPIFSYLT
jgi:prolipoprotein diacylglyceryltransferase